VDEPAVDFLQLADWRRRIADLYAQVRSLANDPRAAHDRWQAERERLYREHPASPVPAEKRAAFRALHFPYDSALRFEVPLIREAAPTPMAGGAGSAGLGSLGIHLPISTGQPRSFDRIGRLEIPFANGSRRLSLFWLPEYSGGLFLAFRDATNGHETYGGGRYLLDTGKGSDLGGDPLAGTVVVDFNFSYQPSCAFDPMWSCPLAAPENHLDIEVRAGERIA
jgi:uncharacterized protein (DUF1684 family)